MRHVPAIDSTGLHALRDLVRRSRQSGTLVLLSDVHAQPVVALERSGLYDELGEENVHGNIDDALKPGARPPGAHRRAAAHLRHAHRGARGEGLNPTAARGSGRAPRAAESWLRTTAVASTAISRPSRGKSARPPRSRPASYAAGRRSGAAARINVEIGRFGVDDVDGELGDVGGRDSGDAEHGPRDSRRPEPPGRAGRRPDELARRVERHFSRDVHRGPTFNGVREAGQSGGAYPG